MKDHGGVDFFRLVHTQVLEGGILGILQGISENCLYWKLSWRFMTLGGLSSSDNCRGFQNACLNLRKIILQCSLGGMKLLWLHEQSKEAGFVGLHYQSQCPASDCATVFYEVYRCKADLRIWYLIWDLAGGWTERMMAHVNTIPSKHRGVEEYEQSSCCWDAKHTIFSIWWNTVIFLCTA